MTILIENNSQEPIELTRDRVLQLLFNLYKYLLTNSATCFTENHLKGKKTALYAAEKYC